MSQLSSCDVSQLRSFSAQQFGYTQLVGQVVSVYVFFACTTQRLITCTANDRRVEKISATVVN